MKKKFLKLFCLTYLLIFGLHVKSQTVDYQNSSLGASCNVFASATTVDNIIHLTTIGKVGFNTTEHALEIANQYSSGNYNSGQFRLAFNFQQGYTYVIKITVAVIKSVSNMPDPSIRVNLAGTTGSNSSCSYGNVGSSLSGNQIKSIGVSSSTYTEKTFNYSALSSAFSYLLIDAVPASSTSDVSTVYIRKIIVEEGPPPVSFTVTSSSANVECGTSTAKNFTINNVYSTPNVTGYTWNLGTTNNGWIYNGTAAPQTINTGTTNTLSLTPVCGASSLSSISASVTANSTTYSATQWVPTIQLPAMSIVGSGELCSGTTAYSVSNLPCSATVSWSVEGESGIATINSSGVLTKTGTGQINVKATVTACGITSSPLAKTVIVGTPAQAYGMTILDPNVAGEYLCPNTQYYAEAAFMGALYEEYFWILPVDWYSPDWGSGSSYFTTTGQYALVRFVTASYPTSGYITVYGVNSCGLGVAYQLPVSTENCGARMFSYRLSPNPAKSILTVEPTGENQLKTREDITEVRIFTIQGLLKLHKKFIKGTKKIQINVEQLQDGIYFIEIGSTAKKTRLQFLIKR